MGEIRLVHADGKVIPVEFQRKHIKRMHLHVKGPEGRVVLSAPLSMPRAVLEAFVVENAAWIEQKRQQLRCLPVKQPHRYLTGETIDLWGERKVLVVHVGCSARGEGFLVRDSKVFLSVPEGLTDTQRVRFVREQYRHALAARMAELAPSLEQHTGLFVREWRTKD
ncbi:YgjP-like metallopeptidase domain-containing protein, partial [uncultured Selenomonas sp.]|uniref:YgjP-like metallopeptidase domain-containing protein n=1 Tax=uncultured Selenomonas sp. TaxID=159275 RepID=UPI00258A47CF